MNEKTEKCSQARYARTSLKVAIFLVKSDNVFPSSISFLPKNIKVQNLFPSVLCLAQSIITVLQSKNLKAWKASYQTSSTFILENKREKALILHIQNKMERTFLQKKFYFRFCVLFFEFANSKISAKVAF